MRKFFYQLVQELAYDLLDGKRYAASQKIDEIMEWYEPKDYAEGQFSVLEDMDIRRLENSLFFNFLGMIAERYLTRARFT